MDYIKKRFNIIRNDSFLSLTLKISLALAFLHLYQAFDSNFMIEPIIRTVFCFIYPVVIFFFGRYGSYAAFFVFGNYLACTTTFTNFTAFIILTILTILLPKFKYPILALYAVDITIVATIRDKTPVHIAIHILNCIMIYYAIRFLLKPSLLNKKLNLTTDEIIILEELKNGKQQKEIEQFSQNTVCNKLKQARERNGVATTEELIKFYREK